ncbi:MAG: 3'-5' exonuclease [Lentimicrobium sp.]|jgi:DNA polymerase-3 subunit epsilon|nr:3'-5' exonuclease [Lentimicrobium sp.]MDD2528821.1 3'-5' exonuclease [Lentimicrobiaceae bacterium]MDD4597787.1 3'-5' exonuclease [Lentimicrobiaceae bacterium]MDY0025468.1 3'-5' exonuclease [Lentimicrobium sp.]HAH58823.1 DNA polymerase III subunit epsilon [Bacteroidales bacterium]
MTKLNLTRPFAVFDLETTGTNVGKDKIVEISAIKINPDGSEEILDQRLNPEIPIPPEVTKIHGISDEDVKDAPTFKVFAPQLLQFLGNADLGGYNSNKFDIPLLVEEFLRAEIDFDLKGRRFIDVQNIFHKMEPRTLKAAYKFYCNADLVNAHSALADTRATYEVLCAQLERYEGVEYEDREGNISTPVVNDIKALHDFSFQNRNADLVGHLIFNQKNQEVFNFGKHKGKCVEDIFSSEPSYYDWMIKSDFPLYTKKIITAIKLRGFNNTSVNINK